MDERADLAPEEKSSPSCSRCSSRTTKTIITLSACFAEQVAFLNKRGLKLKDMWPILGNKGASSEVRGHRFIGRAQAKRLAEFFFGTARSVCLIG